MWTEEEAILFPPLFMLGVDLSTFSDSCAHIACFEGHELSGLVAELLDAYEAARTADKICCVCEKEAQCPDDFFMLPVLTLDQADPLFCYNCKIFHRSCLPAWSGIAEVIALLKPRDDSSLAFKWLLQQLDRAVGFIPRSEE